MKGINCQADWGRSRLTRRVLGAIGACILATLSCSTLLSSGSASAPENLKSISTSPPTLTHTAQPSRTQSPTVTPTPVPASRSINIHLPCPEAPPSQLEVGLTAYVSFLPQTPYPLLPEPGGTAGESARLAESGEQVTVKDGPECYDNKVWWLVVLEQDLEGGWLPESHEGAYLLLPLMGLDLQIANELNEEEPLLLEGVIFRDDFDRDTQSWPLADYEDFSVEIRNGVLAVDIKPARLYIPMLLPDLEFEDLKLEIDVWVTDDPNGSQFGLICRRQANLEGYEFRITDVGEAYIYVTEGDTSKYVDHTFPRYTQALRPGEFNRLVATCSGKDLQFTVNGELIAAVQDDTYRAGRVGFFAGSGDLGEAVVAFDNFVVREP